MIYFLVKQGSNDCWMFSLLFSYGCLFVGICPWCIGLQFSCWERGCSCSFSCCGAAWYWWWMGCWYNTWDCSTGSADRQDYSITLQLFFWFNFIFLGINIKTIFFVTWFSGSKNDIVLMVAVVIWVFLD